MQWGASRWRTLHQAQLVIDGKSREVATQTVAFHAAGATIGGLLPTGIFSRIYISNRGGFAMFEPKQKKPVPLDHMMASLPAREHRTAASNCCGAQESAA